MAYITAGYPKSACRGVDLVLDTRETLTTNKVFLEARLRVVGCRQKNEQIRTFEGILMDFPTTLMFLCQDRRREDPI